MPSNMKQGFSKLIIRFFNFVVLSLGRIQVHTCDINDLDLNKNNSDLQHCLVSSAGVGIHSFDIRSFALVDL